MFSSFPKYRLPDNLTSTNCSMFFLTFLDFHPRLQQTAGLFSHFSCFSPSSPTDLRAVFSISLIFTLIINRPQGFFLIFPDFRPRLQQTAGLFSHFSCFLPSSTTDRRAFFSFFLFFALVSNNRRAFFSFFLFFALTHNRPQGFFLIFLVFCPRHVTDIQPYSRYSPIPDHPDHITGNKKAKNKRSIILARLFSAYFSSFQNISHHSRMSHHSRISPIIPKYLSTFQLILAVRSYLLSAVSTKIL